MHVRFLKFKMVEFNVILLPPYEPSRSCLEWNEQYISFQNKGTIIDGEKQTPSKLGRKKKKRQNGNRHEQIPPGKVSGKAHIVFLLH